MSAFGFIMGISVFSWAAEKGMKLSMQSHLLTGSVIMVLFIAGAVSGFMLRQDRKNKQQLLSAHKWVNILSMILFIVQSVTGSLALIRVL
jgi:cytochrome bd-type quinol oxidase subunit 1